VRNEDLGIDLEKPPTHPVLVVRESKHRGLPVLVAPGSGSFRPSADELALVVDPGDCEPPSRRGIAKHTRFRMTDQRRMAPEKLRRRMGRLNEKKHRELLFLRQQIR
jgi:hypothetical protein